MFNHSHYLIGVLAVASALSIMPLAAQSRGDCRAPIDQRLIAGCTVIIDNPAETPADRSQALRIRGFARLKFGQIDGAIADYSANIAIDPKNALAYYDRALIYTEMDDTERAIADYSQTIALDPSFPYAYMARGLAYATHGDATRARADYDQAIRLKPEAGIYRSRGVLRKSEGDYNGAIADLSAAIGLDPKDALAYAFRGSAHRLRKDDDKALADFESALRLDPREELALSGRANVRAERGDIDGAIADYTAALAITPASATIRYNRAVAFTRKGDFEAALADQDRLMLQTPEDGRLRNLRAHIRFTAGHFAEAADDFSDVVERTPDYIFGKLLRYIAGARGGNPDSAELRRNAAPLDRRAWPWPIFALYLGEMSREQVLEAVKPMNVAGNFRDCGVAFYLGQYLMVRHRRDEALPYLKQAADICAGDGEFERDAARDELRRLQAAK